MPAPIVDAVTAVLIHDGEYFMIRRHPALLSFSGYHAFPGGKVDAEDAQTAPFDAPLLAAHEPRLMRALVRELQEELGFDLVAAATRGEVARVDACGIALTPAVVARRFNTHFFHIHLTQRPSFELHAPEADQGDWASADAWMQRWLAGDMIAAPPTIVCMRALLGDLHCGEVQGLVVQPQEDRVFEIESVHALHQLVVRSNTLPPADHTNCFVFGDTGSPRLAVDPSPADTRELERLCVSLQAQGVTGLLLTHHHPDHRQFADQIARRYGWPVFMSRNTEGRIRARDPGFLDGLKLEFVGEGDVVTHWLGQPVRTLAIPGHDDGHVALMPDNRAWCIVGDLIQGVGTVVIARPEGNMRQYFESMDRVIALAPRTIFPSHGQGLGTTHRLEETMRHRRMREASVLELHQAGKGIEQILASLYTDIDPRLLPLARMNIEGHLDKLREEGRLAVC